jgi:hypothetical protein
MLDVWVCIPTAQKAHVTGILQKWVARGYKIALWVDHPPTIPIVCNLLMCGPYPGVWRAWNALAKGVMACGADVCVLAGDDMEPDPTKNAQEIAAEYLAKYPLGEGVMQPCGDPKGDVIDGWRNAGRICGSPWLGKHWVRTAYDGDGPVCGLYDSFYADEELLNYAGNLGVLWRREDLTQKHLHWSWGFLPKQSYHDRNQLRWDADHVLFDKRRELAAFKSGRFEKSAWYFKTETPK